MKTINIKESLIRLDRQTGFKYTLTDLYEACMLNDDKKKELAQYIEDKDIPGMSAMLSNEAGVMTENVSDDIPDEEMPEDIGVEEDFRPGLTDCPACGDMSFDTKRGRCTKCSYRESLSGMNESWHDAYQSFADIASDMYPRCSAEDVNKAVEDLYLQHQGEPDWDNAWLRWLEPSGEPEDDGFAEQQAKWEAECKRIKGHVGYSDNKSLQELWPFENDDDQSEYTFVKRKSVVDSDGFYTDYTWYKAPNGLNVFVFGDSEVYTPEEGYFDYETDSDEIAADWFDSYVGFADDDEYLVEGPLSVLGDAAGKAVGDAWKGIKNFAKGAAETGKDVAHTAKLVGKAAVRDVKASKVAAKARDAARAAKGANNVDEFKADYKRRQDDRKLSDTKRETKYQGKRGATIGDVQDWKFVIGNRKMNYDQFMKLPSEQRANLIKSKKVKCLDLMGRETSFQDQAKRMNGLTEHLMRETYAHFDFKSGANPYIAFNDVDAARMLRKYKGKVTNTDGKFYTIDDTEDTPSDKFAVDRTLTERAGQSHPEEGQIYDVLMKVPGTTKVEFDWCGSDGIYKVPENHLIMLVFTDNKFDDPYFANRKNWKVGVMKALSGLGWSLEDPIEDCDTYLYLVMQKRQMNEATAVLDRPKVSNVHTHKGSFSGIIDAHMNEINDMINANVPASHIVHCLRDWVAVAELTKANARYAQSALVRMAKMRSAAEVGTYIYNIRLKAEDDSYASLDSQIRGNRYHESLNEAVLKEMDIDSQDLLVMANDAYKTGDVDFFTSRTDDELAQLWVSCSITDDNPYGAPYDDEVYDAIHSRPNGKEIMNRAFETVVGKMPRHNLERVYSRYCGPDGCDLSDDDMRASIVKYYMNEAFERHVDLDRIAIDIANYLDEEAFGENWIEVFPVGSNNPYSLVLEITGADETPRKAMIRADGDRVTFMFKNGSEGKFDSAKEIARFIAGEYGLSLNEAYVENPREFANAEHPPKMITHWTDAHNEFTKAIQGIDMYDTRAVDAAVERVYRDHRGEFAWDQAWLRWLEPSDPDNYDSDEEYQHAERRYQAEKKKILGRMNESAGKNAHTEKAGKPEYERVALKEGVSGAFKHDVMEYLRDYYGSSYSTIGSKKDHIFIDFDPNFENFNEEGLNDLLIDMRYQLSAAAQGIDIFGELEGTNTFVIKLKKFPDPYYDVDEIIDKILSKSDYSSEDVGESLYNKLSHKLYRCEFDELTWKNQQDIRSGVESYFEHNTDESLTEAMTYTDTRFMGHEDDELCPVNEDGLESRTFTDKEEAKKFAKDNKGAVTSVVDDKLNPTHYVHYKGNKKPIKESKSELDKLNTILAAQGDELRRLKKDGADQSEIDKIIKDIEDTKKKIASLCESFEDMLNDPEVQRRNSEYADRMRAKYDKESELAKEAKSWPDDKVLTYEEALALAKAYYVQGGDSFYETIEKYQFDDEVRMFGPMTVGQMKRDFGVYDSVRRDRMAEGKSELDKLNTSLSSLRDKLVKLRNERADQEEIDKVTKDIEDTNRKIATLVDDKILAEDYNVKFYQVFQNPEKPTDNGKMVAQAGTEEEAEEKGKKLCGDGNYFIKAVCDDGKTRYLR